MRWLAVALLGGCAGHPPVPQNHVAVAPPPPAPSVPADCTPGYIMYAVGSGIEHLDSVQIGKATVALVECHVDTPPDDPADQPKQHWHVYVVRTGDAPYVAELDLGVGWFQEGFADADLLGAVPDAPLIVVRHQSTAMDIHDEEILVYRVDGRPALVKKLDGTNTAVELGPHEAVVSTCFRTQAEHDNGIDCLTVPAEVTRTTLRWTIGALEVK